MLYKKPFKAIPEMTAVTIVPPGLGGLAVALDVLFPIACNELAKAAKKLLSSIGEGELLTILAFQTDDEFTHFSVIPHARLNDFLRCGGFVSYFVNDLYLHIEHGMSEKDIVDQLRKAGKGFPILNLDPAQAFLKAGKDYSSVGGAVIYAPKDSAERQQLSLFDSGLPIVKIENQSK